MPKIRKLEIRNSKFETQIGQTLLIILLILAVVLTIALSIASRSVTDVNVSTKEEEAARAFSAAEAGIEQGLIGGPTTGTLPNGATFNVVPRSTGGTTGYNFPTGLKSGETAPIWFLAHDDSSNLICDATHPCFTGNSIKLCWGAPGSAPGAATTPAIQFNVLYDPNFDANYANVQIGRITLDPNASRRSSNNFQAISGGACSINGQDYAFSENITFGSMGIGCTASPRCLLAGRVRFFYNSNAEPFGADTSASGVPLPLQGKVIESTGAAGEANRKIQVVRQYPDLPPIFDFALFAGSGGLTKTIAAGSVPTATPTTTPSPTPSPSPTPTPSPRPTNTPTPTPAISYTASVWTFEVENTPRLYRFDRFSDNSCTQFVKSPVEVYYGTRDCYWIEGEGERSNPTGIKQYLLDAIRTMLSGGGISRSEPSAPACPHNASIVEMSSGDGPEWSANFNAYAYSWASQKYGAAYNNDPYGYAIAYLYSCTPVSQ